MFWGIFSLMLLIPGFIFIVKGIKNYSLQISDNLMFLLIVFVFLLLIYYLKHIKQIVVKGNKLKYYSILRPFGKTLDLSNYIGKIILQETGRGGSYKVIYLINKENKTSFKIMGLHYKNFENINSAIQLKQIKFSPTTPQYFKLLFFEKIKIESKSGKGEFIDTILGIFKLISIAGIILFVIGIIIKRW